MKNSEEMPWIIYVMVLIFTIALAACSDEHGYTTTNDHSAKDDGPAFTAPKQIPVTFTARSETFRIKFPVAPDVDVKYIELDGRRFLIASSNHGLAVVPVASTEILEKP